MRKLTFFWREVYRFSPLSVERCASVWMLNGARSQMIIVYSKAYEAEKAVTEGGEGLMVVGDVDAYAVAYDSDKPAVADVDARMQTLDKLYQYDRRTLIWVMLITGVLMTAQPILPLNFFSLPLTLYGVMLLGLELSPKTGAKLTGLMQRLRDIRAGN